MLLALCILAGSTALLGMASVALTLLPALGMGLAGLSAAAGFGLVSLAAGVGAAVLALGQERMRTG
ncbi:hypothetical protein [Falsiroseomonas tokyonensis]|uniref:Major facilitator superfamily (MFS) profile domain-containing protein n=1 Tax=Falsiroseomonas tokyonensis TaxID=430521 RepID=A0ABV7BYP4_9PROT|nr:hypothetical protein [Falsiroseomonas tokyonensis]MBU8539331.1 hypothetical protein [Falsiroseomonas tokyonensis]